MQFFDSRGMYIFRPLCRSYRREHDQVAVCKHYRAVDVRDVGSESRPRSLHHHDEDDDDDDAVTASIVTCQTAVSQTKMF